MKCSGTAGIGNDTMECFGSGPFTFNDGEVAGFERENVHRIFQSGSSHLIKDPIRLSNSIKFSMPLDQK